jgi:long-subunit acyl-CoA synthetase (AMP-forming)
VTRDVARAADRVRRSRDDPVRWIFYTSGTTAAPKGAQHTDRSVLAGAIGYAQKTHVVEDDIALVAFPFTHVGGIIIGVYTPLLTGRPQCSWRRGLRRARPS